MLNPNVARPQTEYERTENILADMTPNPADFKGTVYTPEEVQSDIMLLRNFKRTPEYQQGDNRSDARLLEKTFTSMVESDDWFGEEESYGDDEDYRALITYPTAEIDDAFNHIDVIAMIGNEATGGEVIPFAIDLTYNTNHEKMRRKFSWRHVYGKKNAPESVSEFGEDAIGPDWTGRSVVRTQALKLRQRNGLKIPGFAAAKYFEDKDNPDDPVRQKGRIELMPRFVVGYTPELAEALAHGAPTKEELSGYGAKYYEEQLREYTVAKKCAKWCTLVECLAQATDLNTMLASLDDEDTRWMRPDELAEARQQAAAMERYFGQALKIASEKAANSADEAAARDYARRDDVCVAILAQSSDTYAGLGWKR